MSEIKKYKVDEPYLKIKCSLGEGPFYETTTNTLRFVDIVTCKIHTVDLKVGPFSLKSYDTPTSVGTTADIAESPTAQAVNEHVFVCGGKYGIGLFNRKTGDYKLIKDYWTDEEKKKGKHETLRGNDGSVDCMGRYWVGVMNDPLVKEPSEEGCLFRLDPDLSIHRILEGVVIPNGTSWTTDNKTMYFADSPTQCVFAYNFDADKGTLSNKRIFWKVTDTYKDSEGVPDGHTLDAEDHLWQCIHGTGQCVRINPNGEVVAEIQLPTKGVTCPRFVDEDLYITSAEGEEEYAGSLFKVHVGVKGREMYKFKYTPTEEAYTSKTTTEASQG